MPNARPRGHVPGDAAAQPAQSLQLQDRDRSGTRRNPKYTCMYRYEETHSSLYSTVVLHRGFGSFGSAACCFCWKVLKRSWSPNVQRQANRFGKGLEEMGVLFMKRNICLASGIVSTPDACVSLEGSGCWESTLKLLKQSRFFATEPCVISSDHVFIKVI